MVDVVVVEGDEGEEGEEEEIRDCEKKKMEQQLDRLVPEKDHYVYGRHGNEKQAQRRLKQGPHLYTANTMIHWFGKDSCAPFKQTTY